MGQLKVYWDAGFKTSCARVGHLGGAGMANKEAVTSAPTSPTRLPAGSSHGRSRLLPSSCCLFLARHQSQGVGGTAPGQSLAARAPTPLLCRQVIPWLDGSSASPCSQGWARGLLLLLVAPTRLELGHRLAGWVLEGPQG